MSGHLVLNVPMRHEEGITELEQLSRSRNSAR
jgi:hypothetical protein